MRILPYLLTALLGITGCTTKTPSDAYKMESTAERAVTSLQTVTVTRGDTVEAIVSGIYLNAVYPERYRDGEYFLIALYDAFDQNILGTLRLNDGIAPVEHEDLADGDPLLQMMPIRKAWDRYYLLRFPRQQQAKTLTLTPGNGQCVKGALSFQKASK
jgi:hypothetical protein